MIAPSETALYYKAADFFISASTSETQGLTYLEALASGTPIYLLMEILIWINVITDQMFWNAFIIMIMILAGAIFGSSHLQRQKKTRLSGPISFMKFSAENFGKRVYEYYLDLTIF